ncbi:hypothetical protein PRIPAC_78610 [Pristionchus pacificus]|uniref:Nuclear receptor n=1 Tax=Pristionchus pacificus TaxID=54126 RepID=A0A2A6CLG6_PRIPA|nr:hypothetical protein PRIPAC_78610 [Pristionchus pacificus]|eukprot:PDM78893.1 nuclear receptor [Pristionchus pacificus]
MKRLRKTKKTFRDCLVCGTLNNTAHMGLDVCRACSVFYRLVLLLIALAYFFTIDIVFPVPRFTMLMLRSDWEKGECVPGIRALRSKKPYPCRSGTSRCAAGKGLNCRRCRLHHIEKVLKVSVAAREEPNKDEPETQLQESTPAIITLEDSPVCEKANILETDTSFSESAGINVRTRGNCYHCSMPLLARVKSAYEKLCFARFVGEQFDRTEAPLPKRVGSDNYPVYPATLATLNKANRILMTCIVEFGTNAFPEFDQLSDDEMRTIATKFFYTFRILDQSYRARTRFANEPHRKFAGYTLFLSEEVVDNFFDDFDKQNVNVEEAKKFLRNDCRLRPRRGSSALDKRLPDELEFCALLVLLFWATNGMDIRDDINQISDSYKEHISRELHIYYRDVIHLDDYALRLGELFSSLPIFEAHNKIKESFEVFRMLDIFTDDTFTYKLAKS